MYEEWAENDRQPASSMAGPTLHAHTPTLKQEYATSVHTVSSNTIILSLTIHYKEQAIVLLFRPNVSVYCYIIQDHSMLIQYIHTIGVGNTPIHRQIMALTWHHYP